MYVLVIVLVSGVNSTIDHIEFSSLAACKAARFSYTQYFKDQAETSDLPLWEVSAVIPPCKLK